MWALQCGLPSRRELYERITTKELRELEVAYAMEPWGDRRTDLQTGIVAAAVTAPYAKRGHAPRPIDFMPFVDQRERQKPRQSTEQMKASFRGFKAAMAKHRHKAKHDG